MYRNQPLKLHDCQRHGDGGGSELFVVEGDSASKSVCRVRDSESQAVLPMQGKPLNAWKASRAAVERNEWLAALIDALGANWDDAFDLGRLRYDRVILLFDPDADGIHCAALMSMFFYRWMTPLVDAGRLNAIQPPLYEISASQTGETVHAYSPPHYQRLCEALEEKQISFHSRRYRGLASMNESTLVETCVSPETRNLQPVMPADAEAAIRVFGGNAS